MIPQVQDAVCERGAFLGNLGAHADPAEPQLAASRGLHRAILQLHVVRIDPRVVIVLLEQRADGDVRGHLAEIHHGRLDPLEIDVPAVGVFGKIALGLFEAA